ncbi:MAG: hypothetical protein IT214_02545 [Chitinophagaceae bacterium]|nr:hypothetical protein [Chitinophagaceae bacterium]
MADVHDKKTRSYNMSRIRGKDTKKDYKQKAFSITLIEILHGYFSYPIPHLHWYSIAN